MYDATLGRFIQRDPLQNGDGMNRYEYVRSRPTSYTDPAGQIKWDTIKSEGVANNGYWIFSVETDKGTRVKLFLIPPGKRLCHTYSFCASEREFKDQKLNPKGAKLNFSFFADSVAQILKDEYEEVTEPEKLTNLSKADKCVTIFYNGPNPEDILHSAKLVKPAFTDKKVDTSKSIVNSQTPFGKLCEGVTVNSVQDEIKNAAETAKKQGQDTSSLKVTAIKYWCKK